MITSQLPNQSHLQGSGDQLSVPVPAQVPVANTAGEYIYDDRQRQIAMLQPHMGDIGKRNLVAARN